MLRKTTSGPLAVVSKIKPGRPERDMRHVTLDIESDPHARAALEAYADSCATHMQWLADVLRERLARDRLGVTYCARTAQRVLGLARDYARLQPDYSDQAWEHVSVSLARTLAHWCTPDIAANDDGDDAPPQK